MTDIDFEELDKAVNSLMNTASSNQPSSATPASSNSAAMSSSDAESSTTTIVTSTPSVSAPRPTPSLVGRRQSGRFMDVVHPAHDMTVRPAPSEQPSRESRPVMPMSSSTERTNDEPTVGLDQPADTDNRPIDSTMQQKIAESLSASSEKSLEGAEQDMSHNSEETPVSSEDSTSTQHSEPETITQPLDSPFRSDVVVEKRPLGGISDDTLSDASDTQTVDPWSAESTEPAEPVIAEQTKPEVIEELRPEVMAVEAASVEVEPNESLAVTQNETSALPKAAGDIPAQYAPIEADAAEPSAIYDQSSIQPLEHPVKKKTGWFTVVLIIILLLVGAGGGVAAYFLLLQ